MGKNVIDECQMFLVPATILFGALGLASTDPLKALLSAMGLLIAAIWCYRGIQWSETKDKITSAGLAAIFVVGGAISTLVHLYNWQH
jgi:hypothetical protein